MTAGELEQKKERTTAVDDAVRVGERIYMCTFCRIAPHAPDRCFLIGFLHLKN